MAGFLRIFLAVFALIFLSHSLNAQSSTTTTTAASTTTSGSSSTIYSSSAATASNSSCPLDAISAIKICYTTYLSALNLPFDGNAPTYMNYYNMKHFMARAGGAQNFTKLCEAVNARSTCMASYEKGCLNVEDFQQALNVSQADAYNYLATYGSDKWACNDGLSLVSKNIYCVESVYFNHKNEVDSCVNTFTSAVQQNNLDCSTGSSLVTCYQNLFKKYCEVAGATYGCQLIKGSIMVFEKDCDSQLPTCPTSN